MMSGLGAQGPGTVFGPIPRLIAISGCQLAGSPQVATKGREDALYTTTVDSALLLPVLDHLRLPDGTGHAVVFLSFLDAEGHEFDTYNENVVGFRYFSSQGGYSEGNGGLDYRYAVFSDYGRLEMPYKRDLNVIYAEGQYMLHTGMMLHPDHWQPSSYGRPGLVPYSFSSYVPVSFFDAEYFDGVTTDDVLE